MTQVFNHASNNYRYRTSSDVADDVALPIAPVFHAHTLTHTRSDSDNNVTNNDNDLTGSGNGNGDNISITITTSDHPTTNGGNHSPSHLVPLPCPSPYAGRHQPHDVVPASPVPLLALPPSSPSPSSLGEPMILASPSTVNANGHGHAHGKGGGHSYRDSIADLIFPSPLPPVAHKVQEYDPDDDTTWIKFGCVCAIIIPLIGCLMWLITLRSPKGSNRKRWGNYSCGVALVIGVAVAIVWASGR